MRDYSNKQDIDAQAQRDFDAAVAEFLAKGNRATQVKKRTVPKAVTAQ